ncbi:stage III sporulation protein AA [Paenibacillus larvae subsp. pulvifaciens]|uniref:Stage III sporulation protein AA n=1 Tax=Paenibacillus larvae subsp. pulvifaciens TaxID=1477 RepID=A0A1V0UWJ0_9BACL|nr:stage III sporulation protein AA [Paenibacillus larvae]ARF69461.1 stage III sporulation protein AA [Paenibacillus larvae subsp. pulvifaciens]
MLRTILLFLPHPVKTIIGNLPKKIAEELEEIRIREGRPLEIGTGGKSLFISEDVRLLTQPDEAYRPTREVCSAFLELLTRHSLYSFEEELKRGYITIPGGHRVGLAGRVVLEHGEVKHLRDVSSFNVRVAREVQGVGVPVLPFLLDPESRSVHQTLVISPPQQGKTTLIRDLARLLSYGWGTGAGGGKTWSCKVGIIDERSELAACIKGVPKFDLGPRTDVLDGCPKAEGMMMMIRSMSPDVVIVDEIGRSEDTSAIHESLRAGIRVIATVHGKNREDVLHRPVIRQLIEEQVFGRYVILSKRKGESPSFEVLDKMGQPVSLPAVSTPLTWRWKPDG